MKKLNLKEETGNKNENEKERSEDVNNSVEGNKLYKNK